LIAQGTEKVPWAENRPKAEPQPAAATGNARPSLFSAAKLKGFFGKLAEAVTGKPTPSLAIPRRKRKEETRGGFMALARTVTNKIKQSIFRRLHSPYDPEAERAYAEQVLRDQMEEWSQGDEQAQDETFSYGSASHFDLHL
jgi:hypothetical protein